MTLAQLIEATKGDMSYGDIAAKAGIDAETGKPVITRGRVGHLASATSGQVNELISKRVVEGLARALGVSPVAVVRANMATIGLDTSDRRGQFADLLPAGVDDDLTGDDYALLRQTIDHLIRLRRAAKA